MEQIGKIKTEEEYLEALKLMDEFFDAMPNTPKGKLLENLADVIEKYESKNYKIIYPKNHLND